MHDPILRRGLISFAGDSDSDSEADRATEWSLPWPFSASAVLPVQVSPAPSRTRFFEFAMARPFSGSESCAVTVSDGPGPTDSDGRAPGHGCNFKLRAASGQRAPRRWGPAGPCSRRLHWQLASGDRAAVPDGGSSGWPGAEPQPPARLRLGVKRDRHVTHDDAQPKERPAWPAPPAGRQWPRVSSSFSRSS